MRSMRRRYGTDRGLRRGLARLAVLLACVTAWPGVAAERDLPAATDQRFYEFCRYGHEDVEAVAAAFESAFPKGADASPLFDLLANSTGFEHRVSAEPTLGFQLGAEPEAYMDVYTFRCDAGDGNRNLWYVLFIVDGQSRIEATALRLFFEDERFDVRGAPFRFENFYQADFMQRALWSITGPGASRAEVDRIMRDAGVTWHEVNEIENKKIDQYRKLPDKEGLFYRLGGIKKWLVFWQFDDEGRLVELQVR